MSLITLPKAENVPKELLSQFDAVRNAVRPLDGYLFTEVRASAFPICPRAYHMSRRLPKKERPHAVEKFMTDSTALMGTALHMVIQKWFGIMFPNNCYGNWKCYHCRKIRRNRYGIQICNSCGREMVYEEFVVKRQKGLPFGGHIDMILDFPECTYLVDFKGSYQDQMREIRLSGQPKENHFWQTNGYACAINSGKVDVGNLGKIDKILIIYIERGRPHRLWLPLQVTPSKKVFKQTKSLIRIGQRSVQEMRVPRGLCLSPKDHYATWCPWKEHCFSPTLERKLALKAYPESHFKPPYEPMLDLLLKAEFLSRR